ncbi:hypothetical protein [Anaerobiospirillum sp. NML120511]|nr:hypothetical protein [Anaerobiospirillum sp. NML120511]
MMALACERQAVIRREYPKVGPGGGWERYLVLNKDFAQEVFFK